MHGYSGHLPCILRYPGIPILLAVVILLVCTRTPLLCDGQRIRIVIIYNEEELSKTTSLTTSLTSNDTDFTYYRSNAVNDDATRTPDVNLTATSHRAADYVTSTVDLRLTSIRLQDVLDALANVISIPVEVQTRIYPFDALKEDCESLTIYVLLKVYCERRTYPKNVIPITIERMCPYQGHISPKHVMHNVIVAAAKKNNWKKIIILYDETLSELIQHLTFDLMSDSKVTPIFITPTIQRHVITRIFEERGDSNVIKIIVFASEISIVVDLMSKISSLTDFQEQQYFEFLANFVIVAKHSNWLDPISSVIGSLDHVSVLTPDMQEHSNDVFHDLIGVVSKLRSFAQGQANTTRCINKDVLYYIIEESTLRYAYNYSLYAATWNAGRNAHRVETYIVTSGIADHISGSFMWFPNAQFGLNGRELLVVTQVEVDLIVAALAVDYARGQVIDYSVPFYTEYSTVIANQNDPKYLKWKLYFRPFQWQVWTLFAISIPMAGIFIWMMTLIFNRCCSLYVASNVKRKPGFERFDQSLWYMFGTFFAQGGVIVPQAQSGRFFIGFWWMYSIVITATFSGNLIAFLTVTRNILPFQSLKELSQQTNTIYGFLGGSIYEEHFKRATTGIYKRIWTDIVRFNKTDPSVLSISHDDHMSLLDVRKFATYAYIGDRTSLLLKMSDTCGLKVIKEKFLPYELAIASPKGSAILTILNSRITKARESGLLMKWQKKWWPRSRHCPSDMMTSSSAVELQDIQGAIYIFCILGLLSLIILFIEMAYNNRKRIKSILAQYF